MFSLETFFDRILFAGFMQILCLVSAISGIVGAAEHEQHSGVVKFLPLRRFVTEVIIISRSKFPAVDRFSI